jgi:hypothetical protein
MGSPSMLTVGVVDADAGSRPRIDAQVLELPHRRIDAHLYYTCNDEHVLVRALWVPAAKAVHASEDRSALAKINGRWQPHRSLLNLRRTRDA